MGVFFATIDNNLNSDAKYQAFIQAIEAGILASGYLEVAPDTGQINPLTVVRPATNTFSGYRIYRTKDTIDGAAKPVYYKVQYGVGSTIDRIKIERAIGTGSNGTGTLTGPARTAETWLSPSATGSGTSYICGGGGEHDMFVWAYDSSQISWCGTWICGRLLDKEDGAVESANTLAYDAWIASSASTLGTSMYYTDGSITWASVGSAGLGEYMPNIAAAMNSGGDVNESHLHQSVVYRNARELAVPFLVSRAGETPLTLSDPAASVFDLDVWGETRTFIPIPFNGAGSGTRYCMLWNDV